MLNFKNASCENTPKLKCELRKMNVLGNCFPINLLFSTSKRQTQSFKCLIHLCCIIKVICTKSGGCLRDDYLMAVNDLRSSFFM